MLSSVYQLSDGSSAENAEKDRRQPAVLAMPIASGWTPRRFAIRCCLSSGALDLKKTGGPSTDFTDDNNRRTVYCKVSRYRLNNFLQVFDFPNPSFTAEQRFTTNVPLQRLYFMNSSFVYKQAEGSPSGCTTKAATRRVSGRLIGFCSGARRREAEIKAGAGFLAGASGNAGQTRSPANRPRPGMSTSRVLLSSNEFEFVN